MKRYKRMTKVTASSLNKRKTKNLIISSLKSKLNLKPERFLEKEQNTQEKKTTCASINFSKTTFQSGLSVKYDSK